jgi:outer membrane receptor protein involved in Fe transport
MSSTGSFDNAGADWRGKIDYRAGPWKAQAFLARSDADVEMYPTLMPLLPPQLLSSRIESNTFDVEIQRALEWRRHSLVLGANARRLTTKFPAILGDREAETIYALFVQDEIRLTSDLTAYLGARLDDHATTGLNVSPRASLVWNLGEMERIRLSVARSFRQPGQVLNYATMNLYGGMVRLTGNEDLDPIGTTSYELGFQGRLHPKVLGRLDLFYYVIEDFLDMDFLSAFPTIDLTFSNAGRTRVWGGEAEVTYKLRESFDGFATYSFQSAHGPNEFSTPRHKASLGLRGRIAEQLRFHTKAVYVGHTRYEPEPLAALMMGDLSLPSRFTVDTFLGYEVRPGLELGVRAMNLFHQVRRQHPLGDEIGSRVLFTATLEF